MVGALTGSALIDRLGRRTLLLGSTTTLVGMLAIIIGLLSSHGNNTQANAGISFSERAYFQHYYSKLTSPSSLLVHGHILVWLDAYAGIVPRRSTQLPISCKGTCFLERGHPGFFLYQYFWVSVNISRYSSPLIIFA